MYGLVMTIHIVVCIFLIIVVLLQSGKAADLAGAFGGMGSQTAFGPRGSATLLSKATTISAVLFMVTSLSLSILATRNSGLGTSVLDGAAGATTPVAPKSALPQSAPLNVNTTQTPAPASSAPVPITVHPTQGSDPNSINIDMSGAGAKAPPAPATPPASKKKK
jgi:preprotein translocase subunit SecG